MNKVYYTSKDLLNSGFLEHYYDAKVVKMFEYIIENNEKMQSLSYANSGCVNYVIPSTLRKMFEVTNREVDVPEQYVYEYHDSKTSDKEAY